MKAGIKTALGIDISDSRINLALLRKDKDGVQLLKAAGAPVPEGAIKDGNIEDAAILAKAIRELKARNKIRAHKAAVSLLARPVLVQIMDMPKQVPTNIGQFVQNEAKRCVALSGKEIALDFCRLSHLAKRPQNWAPGIRSGGRPAGRLFVVAADGERIAGLGQACSQARLSVDVIEPPLLAYVRAFYDKKIAKKFDCNVLLAILRGSTLTLCVFSKQTLDFVRTKDISKEKAEPGELCQWLKEISEEKAEPGELCQWLAEEINSIIQFYDIEVPEACRKWEITVVADDAVRLPADAEESLRAKVASADLQVRTGENVCLDTFVGQNDSPDKPSAVAIGLALGLLGINGGNLRINLVPPESAEIKAVKRHLLITANIIAAALPLMIVTAGVLNLMTKRVNQGIAHKKQTELSRDTRALLRERQLVDKQIKLLSGGSDKLKGILGPWSEVDWALLLEDIRSRTPKSLRIVKLQSKANSRMYLQGLALSYDAIHLFVEMLNKSEHIESAALLETKKDERKSGLVTYTINCLLNLQKKNS